MGTTPAPEVTLREALPWATLIMDYTDKIAALVPDDLLDWRPEDPSGKFSFSLAEIIMHCADARLMFSRQLTGEDTEEGYWSAGPGEGDVWLFKDYSGKQELIDSLDSSRALLESWLDRPGAALTEVPDSCRQAFERHLAKMREKGEDTSVLEKRGPANIVRVMMAVAAHESGHRGTLQTALRLKGINLADDER